MSDDHIYVEAPLAKLEVLAQLQRRYAQLQRHIAEKDAQDITESTDD